MTRKRLTVLLLLALTSGVSVLLGFAQAHNTPAGLIDFKTMYYGTRCMLQHNDPYKEGELLGILYREERIARPSVPGQHPQFQAITLYINLPTSSVFLAPFAALPWRPAYALWMILTTGSFTLAAFLMWNLSASYAPDASFYLICFLLGNSVILFTGGNTAGIVVSLCLVAVWCFLKERFVLAGILCLAISLAIKPHDAGLVWLYFLLAGGVHRKRALQTLVATILLSMPGILWASHVAPHWMEELHANLSETTAPGGINNPGPASITSHTPGMIIDLQTVVSVFRDDPRIYNTASYLVCGALLLVWSATTLRSHFSPAMAWLALAAIAALSMLPTYHRTHDAKLLLLTIPACAMLWAEGNLTGRLALLLNTAGIVFTGDFPLAILVNLTKNLHAGTAGLFGKILTVALTRPVPLILLAMSIFYLWVYVRRAPGPAATAGPGSREETQAADTQA
jgi:hypothetical protein